MMLQHPKVVQKAQAELDRVTENKRLPTLEDRPNLPYIECILKETLRYELTASVSTLSYNSAAGLTPRYLLVRSMTFPC